MNTNRKNLATAYHEAGHAFADWHFGFKVKRATIVPKDGYAGYVVSKSRLHFRSLAYTNPSGARIGRLHERIVSLLAGCAAQRRYRPSSIRSWHGSSDRKGVVDLVFGLHAENEAPHVFRYLTLKAENLVKRYWFVIEHLAGELFKRKTMTGDEVIAAIRAGYKKDYQTSLEGRAETIQVTVITKSGRKKIVNVPLAEATSTKA